MSVKSIESGGPPTSAIRPFRYRDSIYFQDGQWLTILLTAALYLILAASLDAAGHVDNLAIVIPITLSAFVLGVLMSYSRFDGFFALSHSMFTGLACILFMMASAVSEDEIRPFLDNGIHELQARVYFVLLRLLDWVDAAVNRQASADNYVFVFEIAFLMWWLTYLGAWSIFRHGYTWRAIVPAGVVLIINTFYAPQSTIGFLAIFVLLAIVLLIRTNLAEHQLRWREQRVYFQQDIVWDFLRNGLVFGLLVVAAAWILPGLGRNPLVRELLSPFSSTWEVTAENVQRLYQGLNRQQPDMASTFGNNLALGGERNVTDSPVFSVEASQARYWRAVVFDTFDGRLWQNTADTEASYDAFEIVPVASWRAREAISQTVTLLAPVGDVLFGVPEIAQSDIRLRATVRAQAGASAIPTANLVDNTGPIEFTIAHAGRELGRGDRYTFVSAITTATVRDLEGAGTDYPAAIVDRFIQIPPTLSPRIVELAQRLTAEATTPYAKAKAVETYLRTIPYNDAIPAPPADVDPLEYFLFEIQEGYCDYYASAMAMMLRVVGIPARTASGYAEGIYDEESGTYFVTERDAHTWVEVFFPEYGWIEFEPTAGESSLERPPGQDPDQTSITNQQEGVNQEAAPTAPPPDADRLEDNLADRFTGEDLMDEPGGSVPSRLPWWVWVVALLLVAPIGGFLVWRVRYSGPTAFSAELPLVLFERMQRWAQRLGVGASESQTPYEHARQLVRTLPETRTQVEAITDSYVRHQFRKRATTTNADGREPLEDPALVRAWNELDRLFWGAWWRRVRNRLLRRSPSANHYALVDKQDDSRS